MMTVKQMIIMRRDLKMRKGKIAAQAGHACVEAILQTIVRNHLEGYLKISNDGCLSLIEAPDNLPIVNWFREGETKICVYVDSESELLQLDSRAKDAGFVSALICDAGCTEFHGKPTFTCLALEPLPSDIVDVLTGALPLY